MIDPTFARRFADEWIAAWNAHDLDHVGSHYRDDFTMTSPFIATVAGEPSGTLKGRSAVAAYWTQALQRFPDLRFKLRDIFLSVDSIVIYYESVAGLTACEVLFFDAKGKVFKAVAHYDRI